MNRAVRSLLFVSLFVFTGSVFGFAADSDNTLQYINKKKQLDLDALNKAKNNANAQIVYSSGTITKATPAPVVPPDQDPSLPDVPNHARCQNWNYEGENVRPQSGGATGYQCPPGYKCHKNGILFECRWSGQGHDAPSIDNYFCRYEACS